MLYKIVLFNGWQVNTHAVDAGRDAASPRGGMTVSVTLRSGGGGVARLLSYRSTVARRVVTKSRPVGWLASSTVLFCPVH